MRLFCHSQMKQSLRSQFSQMYKYISPDSSRFDPMCLLDTTEIHVALFVHFQVRRGGVGVEPISKTGCVCQSAARGYGRGGAEKGGCRTDGNARTLADFPLGSRISQRVPSLLDLFVLFAKIQDKKGISF